MIGVAVKCRVKVCRFLSFPSGPKEKEVSGEPNGVEREVILTSHQCAPPVKSRCLEAALTP